MGTHLLARSGYWHCSHTPLDLTTHRRAIFFVPYVDGRQVAKALKQESPATPIIMLTGWGAFMNADGETPAQVDMVLSKPPRLRDLRESILRLTQKPMVN